MNKKRHGRVKSALDAGGGEEWREDDPYHYRDSEGKKGNGLEIDEERQRAAGPINKRNNSRLGLRLREETK